MEFEFIMMFYGDMFNVPIIVPTQLFPMKFDTFNSSQIMEKLLPFVSNLRRCQDLAKSCFFRKSKTMS